MKSKLKFALAAAILGVFILGNPRAVSAAPPASACSLLTVAQINATLGFSVRPPIGPTPLDCLWTQVGATSPGEGKGVMLTILGTIGKSTPLDRFNKAKKGGPLKGIPKAVSGLGDDAVYLRESSMESSQLYVKKGNFVFKIRVTGFPLEQAEQKEKTLAQDVLAKR